MGDLGKDSNTGEETLTDLKWVKLTPKEYAFDSVEQEKKFKIFRNFIVPLGCVATAGALSIGLYYFQKGDRKKQQLMMRYRVVAQGFTIVAATISILLFKKNEQVNQRDEKQSF